MPDMKLLYKILRANLVGFLALVASGFCMMPVSAASMGTDGLAMSDMEAPISSTEQGMDEEAISTAASHTWNACPFSCGNLLPEAAITKKTKESINVPNGIFSAEDLDFSASSEADVFGTSPGSPPTTDSLLSVAKKE